MDPEFYIPGPEQWRLAAENKKQGSSGLAGPWTGAILNTELKQLVDKCESIYNMALEQGIAPEQARLFLPAYGMYVSYRWSCSLQSVALFLNQRLGEESQVEIQEYAKAVYNLTKEKFPVSIDRLVSIHV